MGLQDMLAHARLGSMLDVEQKVNAAIRKHGEALVRKVIKSIEPSGRGSLSTALARYRVNAA